MSSSIVVADIIARKSGLGAINAGPISVSTLKFDSTVDSSSTSSGSLIVSGNLSISGNLNVGGTLNVPSVPGTSSAYDFEIPPFSGMVTGAFDLISIAQLNARRYGNVVTISISNFLGGNPTAQDNITITGLLPALYRPTINFSCIPDIQMNSGTLSWPVVVTVYTNGNVIIKSQSGVFTGVSGMTNFYAQATYVVSS